MKPLNLSGVLCVESSGVGGDLKGSEAPALSGASVKLPVVGGEVSRVSTPDVGVSVPDVSVSAPEVKVSGEVPSSKFETSLSFFLPCPVVNVLDVERGRNTSNSNIDGGSNFLISTPP